jgi:hypothetical protein
MELQTAGPLGEVLTTLSEGKPNLRVDVSAAGVVIETEASRKGRYPENFFDPHADHRRLAEFEGGQTASDLTFWL